MSLSPCYPSSAYPLLSPRPLCAPGIGKETVKQLLLHNARVYLAARSPEKGAKAIADLKAETKKEAIYLKMDLSELASVKASVEEFTSKEKALHILINNG
jgi:retinol dehydrogenase 12